MDVLLPCHRVLEDGIKVPFGAGPEEEDGPSVGSRERRRDLPSGDSSTISGECRSLCLPRPLTLEPLMPAAQQQRSRSVQVSSATLEAATHQRAEDHVHFVQML